MPATTQLPTQPCVTTDATETVQGGLVRLTGWFDQINNSVRALLFGEMVTRSQPVKHYPADLYHDAHWIATNVNGPMTFYWAPRTGVPTLSPTARWSAPLTRARCSTASSFPASGACGQ